MKRRVARVGTPPITSEDELAGREIHVRPRGPFYDDLVALNRRLVAKGKTPVVIREVDEGLEDDDILHMVDAGIYPATVAILPIATFWAKVYDSLQVHQTVVLRSDGELAWAIRKNAPGLTRVVNQFVETHRAALARYAATTPST